MTMGNASFNIRALLRGGPVRGLVLGGVLLVAGIVVGTAMMVGVFRERALQSAERELDNTVLLLARHFDQQLNDFITIQREVAAQAQLEKLATPEAFRAQMSTRDLHQALKAKAAEILAALDSVEMDYTGSADSFRYGGGRDLSRLGELAPEDAAAGQDTGSGG